MLPASLPTNNVYLLLCGCISVIGIGYSGTYDWVLQLPHSAKVSWNLTYKARNSNLKGSVGHFFRESLGMFHNDHN